MNPFSLEEFVRESNRIEGIHRSPTGEEVAAMLRFLSREAVITISDLVDFVAVYQPNARLRVSKGLDVRVGNHYPPRGGPEIQPALQAILDESASRDADAYSIHVRYETLHPFTDGNGRSGRALWLWMMGGISRAPLGFLHHFYYQSLQKARPDGR